MIRTTKSDCSNKSALTRQSFCIPAVWRFVNTGKVICLEDEDQQDEKAMKRRLGFGYRCNRITAVAATRARPTRPAAEATAPHFHSSPHHQVTLQSVTITERSAKTCVSNWDYEEEDLSQATIGIHELEKAKGWPIHRGIRDQSLVRQDASLSADLACGRDEAWKRHPEEAGGAVYEEGPSHYEQDVPPTMCPLNQPPCIDNTATALRSACIAEHQEPLSNDSKSIWDDNVILSELARDRRNLVIDSLHPDVVPHIVITPPASHPQIPHEGYLAYILNATWPQSEGHLMVPPEVFGDGDVAIMPPNLDPHSSWHFAQCYRESESPLPSAEDHTLAASSAFDKPRLVFSHSRFQRAIESASQERLFMYHVIPSLHRIQFKVNAIIASTMATSFRRRWDSPSFVKGFEKPFQWTDPAELFLLHHNHNPSTIILESLTPCTVPHIIIEQAPPQSPLEASQYSVPPQLRAFGYYLTVPFQFCHDSFYPYYVYDGDCDDEGQATPEMLCVDEEYASESESELETVTPMTLQFEQLEVESTRSEVVCGALDQIQVQDQEWPSVCDLSDAVPLDHFMEDPTLKSEPAYYDTFDEDEDDEGLPPLDDWYLSIAARTGTTL